MYTNLELDELNVLVRALSSYEEHDEVTGMLEVKLQAKIDEHLNQPMQDLFAKYRDGALDTYSEDGKIEIDDNALVSIGDEPGAYVMGWLWVTDAAADIEDSEDEVDSK